MTLHDPTDIAGTVNGERSIHRVIDIDAVRADTAGCETVVHFNNAGSSLPPRPVVDAMVDYLRFEERSGGYETAAARADDLEAVYPATAEYLRCDPSEIAVTTSAADSWWRAFSSIPLEAGDRILVSPSEYHAAAMGWLQARDRGVEVTVVPYDDDGVFDLEAFAAELDERVKVVSFTMIAMTNGAVHPAEEVGRIIAASGSDAIYLLDACQAAGQLPLDVDELGCDFLTYTGRKFVRGPRGTGVLYARSGVLDRLGPSPFVDGRSVAWTSPDTYEFPPTATRFEFGEYGYGARVALGVATRYLLDVGIDAIADRVASLSALMRSQLRTIAGVRVLDRGLRQCGIVTFDVGGRQPADVQAYLSERSINVSTPGIATAQLELTPLGRDAVVRAGVHYFNTEDEVARLCQVVADFA